MHTIAIDCGASFVKIALFEDRGKLITMSQKASPAVHGNEDVFAPVQIKALISLVKELLSDLISDLKEVNLCISNEMHGFILAYEDGTPYTDYISWQKEYGLKALDCGKSAFQILSADDYKDSVRKSGMGLRAGLPSSNLLYLIHSGKIQDNNTKVLYFYTLGDYLIKCLSGKEPFCHPTNAAATGLYDITTGNWNTEYISKIGAEKIVFPLVSTQLLNSIFGKCNLNIYSAIGDQQAALLGAGLENESDLSFNLGTGAQVTRLTKELDFSEKWQIRPFFNEWYLKTIPHLPSGRALNVFVRFIKDVLQKYDVVNDDDKLWSVLLDEENKCDKTALKCDLSFFQNPITNITVGSITNIEEYGLTIGALFKSIFLQMADNFLKTANFLVSDKSAIKRIVFSGGIARRIEPIRKYILKEYKGSEVSTIIENETLTGLYRYSKIYEASNDEK